MSRKTQNRNFTSALRCFLPQAKLTVSFSKKVYLKVLQGLYSNEEINVRHYHTYKRCNSNAISLKKPLAVCSVHLKKTDQLSIIKSLFIVINGCSSFDNRLFTLSFTFLPLSFYYSNNTRTYVVVFRFSRKPECTYQCMCADVFLC